MQHKHRHFDIPANEHVLLDRHGKPVLDKDGHLVYVEKDLGSRPMGAAEREEEFGELPPESDPRTRNGSEPDELLPPSDPPAAQRRGERDAIHLPDGDDGPDRPAAPTREKAADPLISLLDEEMNHN